jgi:hypothetical protein
LNLEQVQPVTLTAQAGSVLAPGEDANGVLDTFCPKLRSGVCL